MPGFEDYYISAGRDYKNCLRLEQWLPDEAAASGCCFFIEQAIEKSLKGYILLLGRRPEYSRNIEKLLDQCRDCGVAVPDFADDIADSLTLWAVDVRYDPFIRFSERKHGLAKQTFDWAYGELSRERDYAVHSDTDKAVSEEEVDSGRESKPDNPKVDD